MKKFPVLMYHNVVSNTEVSSGLSISVANLEQQFQYLSEKKYTTFHFSELESLTTLPSKTVVITFDDVTENQLILALPLLVKYKLKATFFIPFKYIGKTDLWNNGTKKIMTLEQLKTLNSNYIELGHHSYEHRGYASLSALEIKEDFDKCYEIIKQSGLKVSPALAYPYGNFPKKGIANKDFKKILEKNNIKFGLRIGNRLSSFPFSDPFEIKRIDIKGEDSLLIFKLKLKIGKLSLF
ncbi:polysaccharide deacetylase family protein [Flavobacterium sp.]